MGRILTIMLFAALLVACGDDDDTGAPADDPTGASEPDESAADAPDSGCGLVSVEEVEDLTGTTVGEATALPQGCQWTLTDEDEGALYDWQAIPADAYDSNREAAGTVSSMSAEPIDGLGTEAFLRASLDPDGNPLTAETWVLLSDDSAFFVRSTLPSSDEVIAAQRELAELIAQRSG